MNYYKNSLILTLIIRFWDFVTCIFSGSLFYGFFQWISSAYKSSLTHRLFTNNGSFDSAWENSVFRLVVEWCLNLVPDLLRGIYTKLLPSSEGSHALRLFSRFGSLSLALIGLSMFVLLVTPQEMWNNLYSLVFIAAAMFIYFISALGNGMRRILLKDIGPWPVIFAFVISMSLLWSQSFSLSYRFFFFALTCMLLIVLLVNAARTEDQLVSLLVFCGLGLLIGCVYALVQNAVGVEVDEALTDIKANANMPGRIFSFFENPNSYANILVLFAPLMLTMAFYSPRVWQRLGFGAVFILCCVALMMTYARGGWLALAFAIFVLMVILCPRWIPLIIALCFLSVPFLPDSIISRFLTIFSGSDSSIYTRGYIYSAMLLIIGQNPIFGAGLGAAVLKYAIELAGVYKAEALFVHAHDIYMQIWGESGIFALLSFSLAMYLPMRSGVRCIKARPSPSLKGVIAGCISGLSGSLFFGLTDYAWSYPRVMVMFWFVFSIMCAAVKLSKTQNINKEAGIVHE